MARASQVGQAVLACPTCGLTANSTTSGVLKLAMRRGRWDTRLRHPNSLGSADWQPVAGGLPRLDCNESTAAQIVCEHGENLLYQSDSLSRAQALHPETDHRGLTGSGHSQDRVKVRVQVTTMDTLISKATQQGRGIARHSLIQHQPDCYRLRQAALLSSALSSRFAAANANACCTSSGSSSG